MSQNVLGLIRKVQGYAWEKEEAWGSEWVQDYLSLPSLPTNIRALTAGEGPFHSPGSCPLFGKVAACLPLWLDRRQRKPGA